MKQRDRIKLTPEEIAEFVRNGQTISLASNGHDGYPHLVSMWYGVDDKGDIWMTTYGKSQKSLNLLRDPRATMLLESNESDYMKLKGVMMRGRCELMETDEARAQAAKVLAEHRGRATGAPVQIRPEQYAKRVIIRFHPEKYASWDHTKIVGNY